MRKILFLLMLMLSFNIYADTPADAGWQTPLAREDGSVLDEKEIAEYRVYYGTETGDYVNTVNVTRQAPNEPIPTSTTLTLPTGVTYYLVVTAVDIDGRESLFSDEIVLPIDNYRIEKIKGFTVIQIRISQGDTRAP